VRQGRGFEPDWRDDGAYAGLAEAGRPAFAWEWLRRDPCYRRAAAAALGALAGRSSTTGPCRFGLVTFEPAGLAAPLARPLWCRSSHPYVLSCRRTKAGLPGDLFNPGAVSRLARLVTCNGADHLLLSDGYRSVRLDAPAGTFASGRVALAYDIAGLASAAPPLLTLRRFVALGVHSDFAASLHPQERRARRWILELRAFDALQAGASQRDIARYLIGAAAGAPRWRTTDPSLRSAAQRLVRAARRMAAGGYRDLLR